LSLGKKKHFLILLFFFTFVKCNNTILTEMFLIEFKNQYKKKTVAQHKKRMIERLFTVHKLPNRKKETRTQIQTHIQFSST